MSKLRKSARNQHCHLRLPGVCNHDPETTVLAHIRRGVMAGMGNKPPDICGTFACSACHDVLDRRTNMGGYTADTLDSYTLEAHMRTLDYWVKNDLVKF